MGSEPSRGGSPLLWPSLLWKEWRDHRAALLGYFVGIPPLVAWGLSAFAATTRKDPMIATAAAIGGFAIAALTLFGDLFAGEEQRNTIRLLRRLPGGLLRVFVVKLSFALAAAFAMAAWASLATTSASALLYGGRFAARLALPSLAWLALLFPLAAWISATAIWLGRATLALPAAALALALFAAPIGASFWLHPGMQPTSRELLVAFWTLIAAAPLVAGLSFVLGRRRSASALAPARIGLLATLALFTPAYAWTGVRVTRWLRVEPASATFRIDAGSGALDASGRYAYVDAFQLAPDRDVRGITCHDAAAGDSAHHPLRIELASGAWSEIGPSGARLFAPANGGLANARATPVVGLFEEGALHRALGKDEPGWTLIDAARGEPFEATLAGELLQQEGARAGALLRAAAPIRLPDGRRVWRQDQQLMIDATAATTGEAAGRLVRALPDSRFEEAPLFWSFACAGFGVRVARREKAVWYDVMRERRFEVADDLWIRFVRGTSWLVRPLTPGGNAGVEQRYDPQTRLLAPIAGLEKFDSVVDPVDDGRLLIATMPRMRGGARVGAHARFAPYALALLDPDTGDREPLALPPEIAAELAMVRVAGRTPAGAPLLRLGGQRDDQTWFARLDLGAANGAAGAARVVASGRLDRGELLGASDESTLIVIEDSRRLVRVRLDGQPSEPLFPR